MMIEKITGQNFRRYMDTVKEGYLVNVWKDQKTAKVHNLERMHGYCRKKIRPDNPGEYPKFFASTLAEAEEHAQKQFSASCSTCKLCG